MARFFPVRSQYQFETLGERRFAVGRAFTTELLSGRDASEDGVPIIVSEGAGRGAFPELTHCEGDWQEWDCLVTRIRVELANGHVLSAKRHSVRLPQQLSRPGSRTCPDPGLA